MLPTPNPGSSPHDLPRLIEVLDRHAVEYLIVGGAAAYAYGAKRPTEDIDCVVRRDRDNLDHLAAALRELHARLRVAGMTDAEARALPVQIDATTLDMAGMSTWMTDAGPFDVLAGLQSPTAASCPTRNWPNGQQCCTDAGSRSAPRRWKTSSAPRNKLTGPKTAKHCLNSVPYATPARLATTPRPEPNCQRMRTMNALAMTLRNCPCFTLCARSRRSVPW